MKIRDTAVANAGRREAGRWLKGLREARGLSQSDLAAELEEPHYTFVSQLETGRRSIPSYHIERLSKSLRVPREEVAKELLRHQDPFIYSALFETVEAFSELLRRAMIDAEPPSLNLEEPIQVALRPAGAVGLGLTDLQTRIEAAVGRELHYQSISQTLRKLEKAGQVERSDGRWMISRKKPASRRSTTKRA